MARLIDRTRIETDWTCPRRRYWSTEYEGRGIVSVADATELRYGSALHRALSSLALGITSIDVISSVLHTELETLTEHLREPQRTELRNLGMGHYWGFLRAIWPALQTDYRILRIERELLLSIDKAGEFQMMLQPDLALERLSDNTIWYPDYKTTGFKTKKWIDGWQYAVQLHAGCLALERELQRPVEGAFVIGLYKGYKKDSDGTLRSPFTYLYHLPPFYRENGELVVPERYTPEYAKGYTMRPVSDYPGGVRAWVDTLPLTLVSAQFPLTGPVPLRRTLASNFLRQQEARERAVVAFREGKLSLDEAFPQHFKSCLPVIGAECPYIDACFSPSVGEDPLGTGKYVWRQPHHQLEASLYDESADTLERIASHLGGE